MNIHHKNMRQISQDMQQWTQSNLAELGVYECTYNYFNVNDETFMPIPMHYNWYCEYMEKGLDLSIANRLRSGFHYWDSNDKLFTAYRNYMSIKHCYKVDFVLRTHEGYELLVIAGTEKLNSNHFHHIQNSFHQLSYSAQKIRKEKPNTVIELRTAKLIQNQYNTQPTKDTTLETNNKSLNYKKAKFDNIILTSKEQLYIEYTLFNLTHKEIAYKQKCSQTAVRKVIANIKRKLGNEFMPTSQMLLSLNDKGILSTCTLSMK